MVYENDLTKRKRARAASMTARETREWISAKKSERVSVVAQKRKQLLVDENKHRDDLNKRLVRRNKNVSETKQNQREYTSAVRELRTMKHLDAMENRGIDKQLALMEKKRLVAKAEAMNSHYSDLQQKKQRISEQQHCTEQQRIELQRERRETVRFIRDNYLNQQEKLEKKEKRKLELLEKRNLQEMAMMEGEKPA